MTSFNTAGPWIVSGLIDARYLRGIGEVVLVRRNETNDNRYVAVVCLDAMGDDYSIKTSPQEREANARLIAAAPTMLEALENAGVFFEGSENDGCMAHRMIIEAIAAAKVSS